MAEVTIKDLLEAGVHFGHQTRRWNPKMRRYIHGERGGIHIIDLQQTVEFLARAQEFAGDVAARGGNVLFVGTKKQARDAVAEAAERAGMPYVNHRWLGGLLTNFDTISKRIKRLHDLRDWTENGTLDLLPTRERIGAVKERDKLELTLGGVSGMQRVPDAMLVVDLKTEEIAVREGARLGIPMIGLTDTNCDPDPISMLVPGNDDAIRSCKIIIDAVADVVGERASAFRAEEEAAVRQREEEAVQAAEEQARVEAEERARKQAEEQAAAEAAGPAEEAGAPRPAPQAAPQPEPAEVAPEERRSFSPDEDS